MAEQGAIKLNSFADLREVKGAIKTAPILSAAAPNAPVTKVELNTSIKLPQITAEDNIETIVIKFVRLNPNCNEEEIVRSLESVIQMPEKITAALQTLYRSGFVLMSPILVNGTTVAVYRAKHKTLSDYATSQAAPIAAPKMFKLPEQAVVDPNGKILVEQGLDIAIWKIMQDHEWRSMDDICALLHTYGFHVYAVKTRIITLHEVGLAGERWFDTTKRNKHKRTKAVQYYKLRSHIAIPKLGVLSISPATEASEEKSGDEAVEAILSGNSVFSVPAAAAPKVETTEEVIVKTDTEIRTGDHFPVVLWKVMVGKAKLRVRDQAKLVEPYGFNYGQCSSIMSTWVSQGYLEKEEIQEPEDHSPVGVYTLKDMPMPAFPKGHNSKYAKIPAEQAAAVAEAAVAPVKVETPKAEEPATAAPILPLEIQEGDALGLCIVKVLMKEGTLTAQAISQHLACWGFNSSQVSGSASYLVDRGIAERVAVNGMLTRYAPIRLVKSATRLPVFTSKATTPRAHWTELKTDPATPEPLDTYLAQREAQRREAASPAQASLIPEAHAEENRTALRWKEEAPAQAVPLVRHTVEIKGVAFTLAQIDQVIAEMNTLKLFDWVKLPNRVVQASFEVNGVKLTSEELHEVLTSMK
jgi:hypothetical protein